MEGLSSSSWEGEERPAVVGGSTVAIRAHLTGQGSVESQLRVDDMGACYVYGLCLPLRTYLLTDKWVTVQKHLRTSLGTPLCILFRFLLTYCHFLTLLGRCTVHRTPLTEGSASASTLDSCTVQETLMADGSASEALQAVYCTWRRPWLMGDVLHSVLYMATPHRSYLYIR